MQGGDLRRDSGSLIRRGAAPPWERSWQGLAKTQPPRVAGHRRPCRRCRELAGNGRCLAALRGALPGQPSRRRYEPVPDVPRRCAAFVNKMS